MKIRRIKTAAQLERTEQKFVQKILGRWKTRSRKTRRGEKLAYLDISLTSR